MWSLVGVPLESCGAVERDLEDDGVSALEVVAPVWVKAGSEANYLFSTHIRKEIFALGDVGDSVRN